MSKKTTKPAATFNVGDRVIAQTAATLQQLATGTIKDVTKSGWFIIELDDTNSSDVLASTKGKISARQSSLTPMLPPATAPAPASAPATPATGDGTPAPAPRRASATPARTIPDTCPECESGELEAETDEEGNTTVSCTCGWEETIPAPERGESEMSKALRKAREHYEKTKRPDGTRSADNGDAIAKELRDLEPWEVADLADKVLGVPKGTHFAKYQHLNNGQIRMNSGNRIRQAWKLANEEGDEAAIVRIAKLLNLVEVDDDEEAGE